MKQKRIILPSAGTPIPDVAEEVWTTLDGRKMKVCEMEESHVRNALRLVLRKSRERDTAAKVAKKLGGRAKTVVLPYTLLAGDRFVIRCTKSGQGENAEVVIT